MEALEAFGFGDIGPSVADFICNNRTSGGPQDLADAAALEALEALAERESGGR